MCILYVNIVMSVKISLKLMFIVFIYARVGLKIKLFVFCKFCICICICHSFPAPCPFRWRNIVHVVLEETKHFCGLQCIGLLIWLCIVCTGCTFVYRARPWRRYCKYSSNSRTRWNLHLSSPSVFSGVRVTRSLVLCVCVVYLCLSFCTFYFGHRLTLCCLFFFDIRILITPLVSSNSSIYKIVRRSRTLAYFNTNLN
jgi:hypothetical protein